MIDTAALREKVLDLAIRGKLVPQDPTDEPASVLLERIHEQKLQMVREGNSKQKTLKTIQSYLRVMIIAIMRRQVKTNRFLLMKKPQFSICQIIGYFVV